MSLRLGGDVRDRSSAEGRSCSGIGFANVEASMARKLLVLSCTFLALLIVSAVSNSADAQRKPKDDGATGARAPGSSPSRRGSDKSSRGVDTSRTSRAARAAFDAPRNAARATFGAGRKAVQRYNRNASRVARGAFRAYRSAAPRAYGWPTTSRAARSRPGVNYGARIGGSSAGRSGARIRGSFAGARRGTIRGFRR
jgi:hypothetical protein